MTATGDDFDQLGRAVARVLRDAFATSTQARLSGITDGAEVAEAARLAAEEILAQARAESETIRSQAAADARLVTAKAHEELARVGEMIAAERSKLDADVRAMLTSVRRAVAALQHDVNSERQETLERASDEAAMLLRQARLHHRATAKEVNRMIDAAVKEASRLRDAALEDAAAVAARAAGVVEFDSDIGTEAEAPALSNEPPASRSGRPVLRPLRPAVSRREAG